MPRYFSNGLLVLTGRTRQNKLVHFATGDDALPRQGSFARVRITDAATHFLRGELVEVTDAPRHRARIPVAVS